LEKFVAVGRACYEEGKNRSSVLLLFRQP